MQRANAIHTKHILILTIESRLRFIWQMMDSWWFSPLESTLYTRHIPIICPTLWLMTWFNLAFIYTENITYITDIYYKYKVLIAGVNILIYNTTMLFCVWSNFCKICPESMIVVHEFFGQNWTKHGEPINILTQVMWSLSAFAVAQNSLQGSIINSEN